MDCTFLVLIDNLHYIQVLRKPITYVALHSFSIILILEIVVEKNKSYAFYSHSRLV